MAFRLHPARHRYGATHFQGQSQLAAGLIANAKEELWATDREMYAAAARRQRGQLLGGDEGQVLVQGADEFMTSQNVRKPSHIAAMLVPGFDGEQAWRLVLKSRESRAAGVSKTGS